MRTRIGSRVGVGFLVALTLGACGSSGGKILSEAEFTKARQVQIDRVTTWADRMGTRDVPSVTESVSACTDPDRDPGSGHSTYSANVTRKTDAREFLDDVVRPEMKREGWAFRDRTDTVPMGPEGVLNYYWVKADASIGVSFFDFQNPGKVQKIALISANSECGWLGDLEDQAGDVYPDDPGYLPPTVPGPTIEDSLKRPAQDSD